MPNSDAVSRHQSRLQQQQQPQPQRNKPAVNDVDMVTGLISRQKQLCAVALVGYDTAGEAVWSDKAGGGMSRRERLSVSVERNAILATHR